MTLQTNDVHVNPADEAIRLGPLTVRFLITAENSSGSIAAFELMVPAAQRLAARQGQLPAVKLVEKF